MNILLLDGQTVQTISVARSLKELGHRVYAFTDSRISYGYFSRYVDKKILFDKNDLNADRYYSFLVNSIKQYSIDAVIPMYNDSAEFLSKHKEKIEADCNVRCFIPSYNTFVKGYDKSVLMSICKEYGIPHPKTSSINLNNIEETVDYVGFPSLIKPNISSGARGILYINSLEELKEKLPESLSSYGECTLQEYVDHTGIYYNVMMYRDKMGKCRGNVIIKIMRYFPLEGGTSSYCETITNPQILDICSKTLEKIKWHGFADFDIMESKTGEYKIIEINPRVPASIHAAYAAGINFPEIMLSDEFLDVSTEEKEPSHISLRFFGLDVMWFLFSKDRFKFRPSWFKFFGEKTFYQDGSLKDPFPMLVGCLAGVVKYLNPSFRKSKLKK